MIQSHLPVHGFTAVVNTEHWGRTVELSNTICQPPDWKSDDSVTRLGFGEGKPVLFGDIIAGGLEAAAVWGVI